jgi:hypothetical protein
MGKTTTKQILAQVRDLMPAEAICLGKAYLVSDQQVIVLLRLLNIKQVPVDTTLIGRMLGADLVLKARKDMRGKRSWSRWHSTKGKWVIEVCEDDSLVMRRYHSAREIKRILDHTMARVAYEGFNCHEQHHRQKIEGVCDYFAACLLIPRLALKKMWKAGLRDISCLAQHFLVPEHVMEGRVNQLGLIDDVERNMEDVL